MKIGADGFPVAEPPYTGVVKLMANPERVKRLIVDAVADLDMSGLTVVTEAATDNFLITPVLAAVAGARVFALAGEGINYKELCNREASIHAIASLCGVEDKIAVMDSKVGAVIGQADIITNLGEVRPIDKTMIGKMKPGAMIICMHEEWEKREEDVDLKAAKGMKIPVIYVEENELFGYCGLLCMKMLFDAGVEVYKNRILVLGGNKYGKTIYKCLKAITEDVRLVSSGPWVRYLDKCDAVVVADFDNTVEVSDDIGIPVVRIVENGRMTKTLGYLGPKPVIDIHAKGFKLATDKLIKLSKAKVVVEDD